MSDPLIARERDEPGAGQQPAVPVALREVSKLYRHGQSRDEVERLEHEADPGPAQPGQPLV